MMSRFCEWDLLRLVDVFLTLAFELGANTVKEAFMSLPVSAIPGFLTDDGSFVDYFGSDYIDFHSLASNVKLEYPVLRSVVLQDCDYSKIKEKYFDKYGFIIRCGICVVGCGFLDVIEEYYYNGLRAGYYKLRSDYGISNPEIAWIETSLQR